MKCPYENIECEYVDTSIMNKDVECQNCEHYINWKQRVDSIRETGALPDFEWLIEKIKSLFKPRKKKVYINIDDIPTFFPSAEEIQKHSEYMTDFWQRNGKDMSAARDYIMTGAGLTINLIERKMREYEQKYK